jgi:dihydroorotase
MKILLQRAKIIDANSPHHLQTLDILIEDGIFKDISNSIPISIDMTVIQSDELSMSIGWIDINVTVGEPGFEHRENYNSLAQSAANGGFTHVALMPNTYPVIQNAAMIEKVKSASTSYPISFIPIGALSNNCDGKELAEIYDMATAGAYAFSDGNEPNTSFNVLKRGLQYALPFDGLILHSPEDVSMVEDGMVHEGLQSVSMGLKGRPAMAEILGIQKALYLVEYCDAKIHLMNISTAEGVELIRAAKKKGLKITASCAVYNLKLEDNLLDSFDTNYKVLPPLREKADREALIAGLMDATIDVISSNHTPLDEEMKNVEFDHADFGMTGIQTMFSISNEAINDDVEKWISTITTKPREILKLNIPQIKVGEKADITFFDRKKEYIYTEELHSSKSKNSPFFGQTLKGKVFGTIHQNKVNLIK